MGSKSIEQIVSEKFANIGEYEAFVTSLESDSFQNKYEPTKQFLNPYGVGAWILTRKLYKEELPETTLELPQTAFRATPNHMLVVSMQNKFAGDYLHGKSVNNPDEIVISRGSLLVVSAAGSIQLPGESDLVLVNLQNVYGEIPCEQIDMWFIERNKTSH